MGVSIRKRAGHWVMDVTHNGQRHVRSLHMKVATTPEGRKEQLRFLKVLRAKTELDVLQDNFDIVDFDARAKRNSEKITKEAIDKMIKDAIAEIAK